VHRGQHDGQNRGGRLDRRCLAEALSRGTELHRAGRFAEAERGNRQILDVDPGYAPFTVLAN
jgi:hypothetical protein